MNTITRPKVEPRPFDRKLSAITTRPPHFQFWWREWGAGRGREEVAMIFTYHASVGEYFGSEWGLRCGMIFHFVRALKFDWVSSIFPGHGVTAGVGDVLICKVAKGLQEVELRVVGVVFQQFGLKSNKNTNTNWRRKARSHNLLANERVGLVPFGQKWPNSHEYG